MIDTTAVLFGTCAPWPSRDDLVVALQRAGLKVGIGRYAVRIEDCQHFSFEHYGGDLGDPSISADAETPERMISDGQRVSSALATAGVRHRFEIYDAEEKLVAYMHHKWPMQPGTSLEWARER